MRKKLVEGEDFYRNEEGLFVFTAKYLRERGYCCASGCKHCPYSREEFEEARKKKRGSRMGGF